MAEFCECKSLVVNGKCTNRNCPLKIESSKKLADKLQKIADEAFAEFKASKQKE